MLHYIIQEKKNKWLQSDDCTISDLIKYIRDKGQLRDTQIEAIETYLFLKIQGQNKPLWQLFSEGFFTNGTDLSKLNINQKARDFLTANKDAFALYDFARTKNGNGSLLVYSGETDHPIPWQTDHLKGWRTVVSNAIES